MDVLARVVNVRLFTVFHLQVISVIPCIMLYYTGLLYLAGIVNLLSQKIFKLPSVLSSNCVCACHDAGVAAGGDTTKGNGKGKIRADASE